MPYQCILSETTGEILKIKLNRPDSLNAINEVMVDELIQEFERIKEDESIKILILSGEGRAFSAGVDLKTTSSVGFQADGPFMTKGGRMGQLLLELPQVTIAQVHGYCFTGALELMMFFDLSYCADNTQFGDTHAKWSVMPRWGMTQRLSRRVGLQKAKELTFRAMRFKGDEAERLGLVNRAYPLEELEQEILLICDQILENSAEAIKRIKVLYNEGYNTTLKEGLQLEWDADSNLGNTDELLGQFEKKKFKG